MFVFTKYYLSDRCRASFLRLQTSWNLVLSHAFSLALCLIISYVVCIVISSMECDSNNNSHCIMNCIYPSSCSDTTFYTNISSMGNTYLLNCTGDYSCTDLVIYQTHCRDIHSCQSLSIYTVNTSPISNASNNILQYILFIQNHRHLPT